MTERSDKGKLEKGCIEDRNVALVSKQEKELKGCLGKFLILVLIQVSISPYIPTG